MLDAKLPPSNLFQVYENELRIRNYSPRTIKTYLGIIKTFVRYYQPKHPREVTSEEIRHYIFYLIEEKDCSRALIDQSINALKFLYVKLYKRESFNLEIPRPRKDRRLPVVLSKEEILKICHTVHNPGHRLMLELMYASGLRISEILYLRVKDINLAQLTLYVRGGKGSKDRLTVFSWILKDALQRQLDNKDTLDLVFPSNRGGALTTRALQKVFKEALDKSGIKKQAPATPSAILLPPICLRPELISAIFKAFLVMPGWKLLTFIPKLETLTCYKSLVPCKLLAYILLVLAIKHTMHKFYHFIANFTSIILPIHTCPYYAKHLQ